MNSLHPSPSKTAGQLIVECFDPVTQREMRSALNSHRVMHSQLPAAAMIGVFSDPQLRAKAAHGLRILLAYVVMRPKGASDWRSILAPLGVLGEDADDAIEHLDTTLDSAAAMSEMVEDAIPGYHSLLGALWDWDDAPDVGDQAALTDWIRVGLEDKIPLDLAQLGSIFLDERLAMRASARATGILSNVAHAAAMHGDVPLIVSFLRGIAGMFPPTDARWSAPNRMISAAYSGQGPIPIVSRNPGGDGMINATGSESIDDDPYANITLSELPNITGR